jgi:hypothetical protein
VISPGATFEIRVAFLPLKSGWSMGRLGIKRAQNVKGFEMANFPELFS